MVGEGDAERLVVLLEARIRDFEKNMEKASGSADRQYRRMRDTSRSATKQLEADMNRATSWINQLLATSTTGIGNFANTLKGFGAGILGFLGISATIGGVQQALASVAKLKDDAAKAGGLSVEVFQELAYAARQSRVEVSSVTDGMRELLSRANEFITTQKGPGADAFRRLGLSPAELQQQLKDPAELLNRIINLTGTLNKSSRVKILNDLFGGSAGAEFLKFLDQGKNGIARLRVEAQQSGEVLGKEVVDRAADIEKHFDNLKRNVGVELQAAILQAAKGLERFLQMLPGSEIPVEHVGRRIVAITKEQLELESKLAEVRKAATVPGQEQAFKQLEQDMLRRIALLKEEEEALKKRGWAATLGDGKGGNTKPQPFPEGTGNYGRIEEIKTAYTQLIERTKENIAVKLEENQVLRVQNPLIDDFGFALSKATKQRELLNAAEKAAKESRTTVTPEQIASIERLATQYANAESEARRLNRTQDLIRERAEELRSTSRDVMGGILTDFRNGTKGAQAFLNALNKIADRLQNMALDQLFGTKSSGAGPLGMLFGFGSSSGGGGLGGLAGGMAGFAHGGAFAGGNIIPFANGGVVSQPTLFPFAKGTGLMGEAGPEAIMPLRRLPSGRLGVESSGGNSGGSQRVHVTVGVSVDRNGNLQAYVKDVAHQEANEAVGNGIYEYDRTLPDRMQEIESNPHRRLAPRAF